MAEEQDMERRRPADQELLDEGAQRRLQGRLHRAADKGTDQERLDQRRFADMQRLMSRPGGEELIARKYGKAAASSPEYRRAAKQRDAVISHQRDARKRAAEKAAGGRAVTAAEAGQRTATTTAPAAGPAVKQQGQAAERLAQARKRQDQAATARMKVQSQSQGQGGGQSM